MSLVTNRHVTSLQSSKDHNRQNVRDGVGIMTALKTPMFDFHYYTIQYNVLYFERVDT